VPNCAHSLPLSRNDEAKDHAAEIAAERRHEFAPSFHRDLVIGVATYAH